MRTGRRIVHALILVLTLVVGATAAVVIVSQTAWFKNWLRGYIVREANRYLNGTLSIDRLGGNLFFGVELENIAVSMDGSKVVAVKDLGLDYNVFQLIARGLSVDSIRLNEPIIYLRREGDTWSLSRLIKKQAQEADRTGPGRSIAIDEIGVTDGSVVVDGPVGTSGVAVPRHFEHLDAKLAFKYEPVRYTVDISHVSFRAADPSVALNALSGTLSVRDDTVFVKQLAIRTAETSVSVDGAVQHYLTTPILNLQVTSDNLSLPEIARLVPALSGIRLQPAFEVKLNGPFDRLGVDLNVRSSAGQLTGTLVADLLAPRESASGTLSVRHLDLSALLNDPKQKSDLTADAKLDLHVEDYTRPDTLGGTIEVTAPRLAVAGYQAEAVRANARLDGRRVTLDARASAYGASATAAGLVTLGRASGGAAGELWPIAVDLHGVARSLDLRRLPRELNVPPASTDLTADYHVTGSVPSPADSASRASAKAGLTLDADARFAPSSVAGAAIAGGSTVRVTLKGKDVGYEVDATVAHLDLQRVGAEFRVPALAVDRYRSSINAQVRASGRGTTPADPDVTASGTITDTSIMGGRIPQLGFDIAMRDDTAHVKANGSFAGFDPAAASGRPALAGMVGGTLTADATVSQVSSGFSPDRVDATATMTLDPSTVGGLVIDKASLDGDYHHALATIRTLDVTGRDLNVHANGTVALDDSAQSNLTVHADSPSLEEIGKLVNQPITGIGKVDVTVTGNRTALQAAGNVTADGVKSGDNGALVLSSDFTARVPDLDATRATVSATTHGTFVTVGGQNINDLAAKTDYANRQVSFDVTAKQPQRTLTTGGALLLHPDHQEVHLQRFSLASQGVTWQMAPDAKPSIQYGGGAVTVEDVRLVNGDQQIAANGVFGRDNDGLTITVRNMDVSTVDAVLLRPSQLTGRLDATATVTTTAAAGGAGAAAGSRTPHVSATFAVAQGGFRQYRYDSFGGTVAYNGQSVTLDTRLQQNPTTWLQAKGQLPVALLTGAGESSTEPVDLHVDSSPIDLGIVQGFTSSLTNVKGTIEAHVGVTGSAANPVPDGQVSIQNASFKVEPTGVVYTDLDGQIQLQRDRIHIDQIRILDNQKKPLTLTGDLAVHEREVAGVSIAVKADDFKIVDNQMGNVRITSNLQLTGEVNAPRVEGDLGVTTGTVNLDPILNLLGSSAYATAPVATGGASADTTQSTAPGTFTNLQVEVHLTVPNDLVVKASDLRTPGTPVGAGALNVTLGGDLWVSKVPYDQIRLVGTVNTVRGTYDFQGRRFDILRDGTVRFEGLDQLDPTLDLRTERVIQAVTTRVNVRGSLSKPEIELSSTPPLEPADIMSLIVFNQPINELGEGQQVSLMQRAQSLATGAVAGQLASSIGNALNLNEFEINTSPDSGAAAQVTVGQQLGQNLFVKVQQGIGDQSQTNVILEYEIAKWLRLQTNVLQGSTTQQQLFQRMQGSGVDLLFFLSF